MSSRGESYTIIDSIIDLIDALRALKCAREEIKQMQTTDGKIYKVDVIVKDENNRSIGFQKQKDGTYQIIADSSGLNPAQLKKQKEFINKIKQRYAYDKIIRELKNKGYQIVEEKKLEKNTIRLLARRWVS